MMLLLLATGWTWAQDKLVPINSEKFEKTAKKVDQKDYNNMVIWAKEVFRQYSDENAVSFTEKSWQDTLKAKATLEKNYTKLLGDKKKADDEIASLKDEQSENKAQNKDNKKTVDSLLRVVKAKDKTIENLNKGNAKVAEKELQIRAKDSIISVRDQRISALEKKGSGTDATLNKLIQDTTKLGQRIQELNKQLSTAQTTIAGLQQQLAAKDGEIATLNGSLATANTEKESLEGSIAQYQKAFEGTKTTINNVYTANKAKPLLDMDVAQLSDAESAWNGMKALMESADPKLAKELKGKVDEIGQWKAANEPMKGAQNYMKGKYDNKQRLSWISQLKKMKLSGDKDTEIKGIVKALEDQEWIKALYTNIVEEKLASESVINDSESLKRIKGNYEKAKASGTMFYHANCYDSYDAAIAKIEEELNQKEPSKKVNSIESFAKFINELRNMF